MSKKIFIDAGHGGSDPGAVGNGLREKDLTLAIALETRKVLENEYTGHSIKMSRTTDKTLSLSQRTNAANAWGAHFFLSIHINAGGGTGFESFRYVQKGSATTMSVQKAVHSAVLSASGWRDRGQKWANFHVLRVSKMPAILTENGFIDSAADAKKLKDSALVKKIGRAHAEGVAKALGLKKKASAPKPTPKPPAWSKEQQEQIARLNPAPKPAGTKFTRTLKYVPGNQMEGNDVLAVQYKIGVKPYKDMTGKVIGTFGPLTRDALKAWQKKNGIKETGEVGIVNWRRMFGEKKDPKPAPKPKPKDTVHRVIVDGKQVGAYGVNKNAANAVENALDKGAKKINVEEAK